VLTKIILFAKAVIAAGAAAIVVAVAGLVRLDPVVLFGGLAAVIGGIVVWGSNRRTRDDALGTMRAAEAERNALIGRVALRVWGEGARRAAVRASRAALARGPLSMTESDADHENAPAEKEMVNG
jgi:hypothetical protein